MKTGDWIIWDGDSHPHPRRILNMVENRYICNIRWQGVGEYKVGEWNPVQFLKKARLCRWDEIPEEFREPQYEIY